MAGTMQFDLVSPERRLVSGQATEVRIPGADGDMTAMPDHAPVIATLRPGVLSVDLDGKTEEYAVFGGFAEIGPEGTTVLAEEAFPVSEVSQDVLDPRIQRAREAHEQASEDTKDAAAKFLADLVAVGDQIGIPSSSRAAAP